VQKWDEISMKKMLFRIVSGISLAVAVFLTIGTFTSHAEDVVVVIDPGHGGENLGGQWAGHDEKDLNLVTAQAMKEYLELFDGITVYLTREEDKELYLQERADFAAEKEADFLFCLHYNMSEEHTLFGAEVWVPAFAGLYEPGTAFAQIEMEELTAMGLFSRGIKTRLNTKGTDYYGIIRACTEYGFPSVIIEHCHLDERNDTGYWSSEEKLKKFGVADATAVAKYFRLKSETLGLDYSGYEVPEVTADAEVMRPDETAPEYCSLTLESADYENGSVTVSVEAADADTYIQYVEFSFDGGDTWQELQPFNGEKKSFTLRVKMGTTPVLTARAYNLYDLKTESVPVQLETFTILPEPLEPAQPEPDAAPDASGAEAVSTPSAIVQGFGTITIEQSSKQDLVFFGLLGALVALLMILGGVFLSIYITSLHNRRYRKSYSQKDMKNSRTR